MLGGGWKGPAVPRLEIRLLGPFEATRDGEPVTTFETASARALLAYLAAEPGRARSRAAVAEMLWPERPQGAALSNLRHVLSVLRRAVDEPGASRPVLVTDRSTVAVDTSADVRIDLVEFEGLVAVPPGDDGDVGAWTRAAGLWRGQFLDGLDVRAGAEWEEWAVVTAERLRREFAVVLGRLTDHHERAGEWELAISYARRLVEVDPWQERGHRQLMRLLARSGANAQALSHFARLERRLLDELASTPEPDTIALADQIRAGDIERVASDAEIAYPAFLATQPAGSPPLFAGRMRQLDTLHRHLDEAVAGHGTIVFVSGEAGSGKTMLTREFMRQAMRVPDLLVAAGTCTAFGGLGDPYLPFRELLGLLCGNVESGYTAGALDREQATRLWEAIPHSARLVSELAPSLLEVMVNGPLLVDRSRQAIPGAAWIDDLRSRVEALSHRSAAPERLQPALFDDYTAVLERLSITRPLLLIVDDLQWADQGSVALLWHLARRIDGMRVLLVVVYRPEEVTGQPSGGPSLIDVVRDLQARSPDRVIELPNDREFIDEYLDSQPNALDDAFRDRLFAYTGGHPLFTVELVRGMQERAEVHRDRRGVWRARDSLDWDRLPSRVEAVIAQRITRLPEPLRQDLTVASVQGQEFVAEVVAEVRSDPETTARLGLQSRAPDRLIDPSGVDRVDGELVGRQRFRHVLFQRYLYDRLDPMERTRLHEATGRSLERLFRDQPDPPVVDLARHFEEAGLTQPAIDYLHRAGRRAIRMAGSEEAIGLLERALALVRSLPDSTERDEIELGVLTSLAAPTMAVRGYAAPEAEDIGTRVLALRERVSPSPTLALALTGMATVLSLRGRYAAAVAIGENALELGATMDDPPGLTLKALQVLGYDLTWMGELADGHATLQRAHRAFDPDAHAWLTDATGSSPGPDALVWDAINTLHRGRPAEAIGLADRGIALARNIGHAFTLCHALAVGGSVLRAMSGDFAGALPFIEEFEAIAAEEHFPFYTVAATIHRGQAHGHMGDPAAGIEAITGGLEAWRSIGIEAFRGPFLGDVAEFHHRVGDTERGLEVIGDAIRAARAQGERLTEISLLVQQGGLLDAAGDVEGSRVVLGEASTAAARTGFALLELRALAALARSAEGAHRARAREALATACARFDEGLETPYVAAARAVLTRR